MSRAFKHGHLKGDDIQQLDIGTLCVMPELKPKDTQVMIRISTEEKKALKSAAGSEDRTTSDWMRSLLRTRLRELGFLPEKKQPKKKE